MIYLLWALLNIGFFIFFIFICFNATKLIKEKFGIFTAIVFVLGILSSGGRHDFDKDNMEPNSNHPRTWKFNSSDSLDKRLNNFQNIELEKNLISKYNLLIDYGKDKQMKNNIPISANTNRTGFVSGTSWEPISINVNTSDDNQKFEYEVIGTIKWNLLGMTIYYQSKHWEGNVVIK
jgi:hypothetical protein